MGGVKSGAALATLSVDKALFEKDIVLQLVCKVASEKQLKVKIQQPAKKSKGATSTPSSSLTLEWLPSNDQQIVGKTILNERNAILRGLAGPVLANALSDILLGGHLAPAVGNLTSAMALSSLAHWMTVARQFNISTVEATLGQLETYLATRSFLIPSSRATLADMDLVVALLALQDSPSFGPNVTRWISTVHAQMQTLLDSTDILPPIPTSSTARLPVFYKGTEDWKQVPSIVSTTTKSTTGGGATDKKGKVINKEAAEKRAKKAAEKKAKQPKKKQQPQQAAADLNIMALEIRVGKITKAWHHPKADKLFCEEIDVGEGEPRQIASGLRNHYKTEDLQDRRVLVLCNLKARTMLEFPSHGMVLCATLGETVKFIVPPDDAAIGERVTFDGLPKDTKPEPENKVAKKKIVEKLLPELLKTNDEGVVVWKTHVCQTSAGPVKALDNLANAQVG